MKAVRQHETFNPDRRRAKITSKTSESLKDWTKRDQQDYEVLLRWLIDELKLVPAIAQMNARLCFKDLELIGRPEVRTKFEEIRTESKRDYGPKRRAVVKLITQLKPAYMITVAYPRPLSDAVAFERIWTYIGLVNAELFGKRWTRDRSRGISGLIIAEPHILSEDKRGCLHFHILIQPDVEIDNADHLQQAAWKVLRFFKSDKGNALLSRNLVHVERIDQLFGLAHYLTKTLSISDFASGEYFIPFNKNGAAFPPPRTRKRRSSF